MFVKSVPAGDNARLIELGEVSASELHARAREMRGEGCVVIVGHSSLYVLECGGLPPLSQSGGEPPHSKAHFVRVGVRRLAAALR